MVTPSLLLTGFVCLVLAGCGTATTAPGQRTVSAASCAGFSPAAQFANARVVFVGTALAGPTVRTAGRDVLTTPARMRVARYLKGRGPRTVSVVTGVAGSGSRVSVTEDGIEPVAGQRWKVYSDSRRSPYDTSICAGSKPLRRVWSVPMTLVPSSEYTSPPQLSVSAQGHTVAAWLQGPPPKVYAAHAQASPAATQRLMVDLGTTSGGFAQPLMLASGASGVPGEPKVAMSGPHLAYIAWSQLPKSDLRIAVLRDGHLVGAPDVRLHDAQPVALAPLRGGRAALVWDQYGHGFPFLQYALVDAAGRLGRATRIAHFSGLDTANTELSINDRGQLVAAWVHSGPAKHSKPGQPIANGSARLIVSTCQSVRRCSRPRAIPLGRTRPACVNPAVAISEDGTATVVAAALDPAARGCARPLGIWEGRGAPGHGLGSMSRLVGAGDGPRASPAGRGGALTVFNPGAAPYQTLAWSMLIRRRGFSKPVLIRDPSTIYSPSLAANTDGQFLVAWTHASARRNATLSIRVALGQDGQLGAPEAISSGDVSANSLTTGIDGAGNAIVIWNDFLQSSSTSGSFGIFAAVHRR
jgi:hypothetical protein